jgi:predicted RecA/RadA family phage recombinase
MKNFIQEGDVLTLAAPYAVASGAGALVGSIFGVSAGTLANGVEGEFQVEGVFELAKAASQAWTVGVKVYWDNTAKNCTTTAMSNTLIGVAVAAVGSGAGEVLGKVRLNGSF